METSPLKRLEDGKLERALSNVKKPTGLKPRHTLPFGHLAHPFPSGFAEHVQYTQALLHSCPSKSDFFFYTRGSSLYMKAAMRAPKPRTPA
jgi:hypothetical protein